MLPTLKLILHEMCINRGVQCIYRLCRLLTFICSYKQWMPNSFTSEVRCLWMENGRYLPNCRGAYESSLGAAKLIKVAHCTPEVGCVMTKVPYILANCNYILKLIVHL